MGLNDRCATTVRLLLLSFETRRAVLLQLRYSSIKDCGPPTDAIQLAPCISVSLRASNARKIVIFKFEFRHGDIDSSRAATK